MSDAAPSPAPLPHDAVRRLDDAALVALIDRAPDLAGCPPGHMLGITLAPPEGEDPETAAAASIVAVLDPRGSATEPEAAILKAYHAADGRHADSAASAALLATLATLALPDARPGAGTAARRLVTTADPLDATGIAALERAGFRLTGRHPYRPLGGDMVSYVMGYDDAAGAIVDLVWGGEPPAD